MVDNLCLVYVNYWNMCRYDKVQETELRNSWVDKNM